MIINDKQQIASNKNYDKENEDIKVAVNDINHESFELCCWWCIKAADYPEQLSIAEWGYIIDIN